jgi:iron complex transport system ATP-binding protein
MAVVPQETRLAFDFTVLEVALMGRYPHLGAFEVEGPTDIAIAREALEATGTRELEQRAFNTLSGGEKQRVVIASALAQLDTGQGDNGGVGQGPRAQGPRENGRTGSGERQALGQGPLAVTKHGALLLDEPTASLDLRYQLEVAALLKRLRTERGLTIVLSTHDLRLAKAVCTHVVLLSRGRVLADGAAAKVLTPPLIGQLFDVDPAVAAPLL